MKAYFSAALACLAAAGSAHAYPPYMDIGTFGATEAQPTCCTDRRFPFNGIADAFYDAAKKSHVAVDASTTLPVPTVTRPLNRTGWGVAHSILRPNSQRESCDFLYYVGHGYPSEFNTIDDSQTVPPGTQPFWRNIKVESGEFMYGGWIRWVYLNACSVMDGDLNDPTTWTKWNKAFNGGAQVVLSFRNYTWFNDMDRQHNTAKLFWKKWTGTAEISAGVYKRVDLGWNIYDAHVLSVTEGIWNASGRALNTTPTLVTSNYNRGYHEWLYYQNNGEASGRYKADRFMWKELEQAQ